MQGITRSEMTIALNLLAKIQHFFGSLNMLIAQTQIMLYLSPLFLVKDVVNLKIQNVRTEQNQFTGFDLCDNVEKGISLFLNISSSLVVKRTRIRIRVQENQG